VSVEFNYHGSFSFNSAQIGSTFLAGAVFLGLYLFATLLGAGVGAACTITGLPFAIAGAGPLV
jgi:hypothetical protein